MQHTFTCSVKGLELRIFIDGLPNLSFRHKDYVGFYAFREGPSFYGITIFFKGTTMELEYETRETWIEVLKLLDQYLK